MFQLVPQIWAQVRESSEIFLAPALEVFSGNGTREENFYIFLILILGGLIVTTIWFWIYIALHKASLKIMYKFFAVWVVFSLGVSSVFYVTINSKPIQLDIEADIEARPENIHASIKEKSILITWDTAKPTFGFIKVSSGIRNYPYVYGAENMSLRLLHDVEFPILEGETNWELTVWSDGLEYTNNGQPLKINLNND